jgi:hypothetical protein
MRIALLALVATLAGPAVRIDVHPAPTGGVDLKPIVAAAAARALAELPHRGTVTIDARPDPEAAIPETGVGGATDQTTGDIEVYWDPSRTDVRRNLLTWIPLDVAHELVHSSRIRVGAGYGPTLGDQLVNEGLADHFAHELYPRAPEAPWDRALTKAQERAYWRLVRPRLRSDHASALYWGDWGKFPREAGYTLGYDIVGRYLAAHPLSPAGFVRVRAPTILASFHGIG